MVWKFSMCKYSLNFFCENDTKFFYKYILFGVYVFCDLFRAVLHVYNELNFVPYFLMLEAVAELLKDSQACSLIHSQSMLSTLFILICCFLYLFY